MIKLIKCFPTIYFQCFILMNNDEENVDGSIAHTKITGWRDSIQTFFSSKRKLSGKAKILSSILPQLV